MWAACAGGVSASGRGVRCAIANRSAPRSRGSSRRLECVVGCRQYSASRRSLLSVVDCAPTCFSSWPGQPVARRPTFVASCPSPYAGFLSGDCSLGMGSLHLCRLGTVFLKQSCVGSATLCSERAALL